MRIFVAGGSGAIGSRLVPLLVARGHDVVASTRRWPRARALSRMGATAVVLDALDRMSLLETVVASEPEVVVHQLSGLAGVTDFRDFDAAFAATNRLRTEGTDHLMAAARAAGARRVVAQSFGNWNYERRGGPVKTEADPFDPDPPETMRGTLDAIRHLEAAVTRTPGIEGIAMRYANLYGPGTGYAHDGDIVEQVRRRRVPVVGGGAGIWSFVHVDDAARATVAAIEQGRPGAYNIADDEPAGVREWLPVLADAVGARPPRHVPAWLGRLAAGEAAVAMSTSIRGAANDKAKRELGWIPRHASWRHGFREAFAPVRAAA